MNTFWDTKSSEKLIALLWRQTRYSLDHSTHFEFVIDEINCIRLIIIIQFLKPPQEAISFFVHRENAKLLKKK
ncbi:MAG: hypothetical protein ED554_07900 [Synechococcus sp. YX04-3]|nr:MAG: hypothetical protein ED554_07900 [Synechococcus sp. YX04-3]